MKHVVDDRAGKPVEVVSVECEGCSGCIGAAVSGTVDCATLPPCSNDPLPVSLIWVEATPENIARAVRERMARA